VERFHAQDGKFVVLYSPIGSKQVVGMVPARALVVALLPVVVALQRQGVLDYHMEWSVLLVVGDLPRRRREELPQLNIVVQCLHRPHHPRMMMMMVGNHSLIS
jgi:hypothetical protein